MDEQDRLHETFKMIAKEQRRKKSWRSLGVWLTNNLIAILALIIAILAYIKDC